MVDTATRMMVDRAISDNDKGIARATTIMLIAEINAAQHELERLHEVMPDIVEGTVNELTGKNKE